MSTKDGKHEPNLIYQGAGFWPTYVSTRCPYDDGVDGCQLKKRREPCVCERYRDVTIPEIVVSIEQPGFIYFDCRDWGFDSVQRSDFKGSTYCPLCAGDSGHDVRLSERACLDTDKPEGFDARKGTRAEQEAHHNAHSEGPIGERK